MPPPAIIIFYVAETYAHIAVMYQRMLLAGNIKEIFSPVIMGITDKDIETAFQGGNGRPGARTWEALQQATKIGTVCGKCKDRAEEFNFTNSSHGGTEFTKDTEGRRINELHE